MSARTFDEALADLTEFFESEVGPLMRVNGPGTFMVSFSLWAVDTGLEEFWTIYDDYSIDPRPRRAAS